jgi:hypothetical protein
LLLGFRQLLPGRKRFGLGFLAIADRFPQGRKREIVAYVSLNNGTGPIQD